MTEAEKERLSLWTRLRPYRSRFALGTLLLLLTNATDKAIPWLLAGAVDALRESELGDVRDYAFMVVGLAAIMWVVRSSSRIVVFNIGRDVESVADFSSQQIKFAAGSKQLGNFWITFSKRSQQLNFDSPRIGRFKNRSPQNGVRTNLEKISESLFQELLDGGVKPHWPADVVPPIARCTLFSGEPVTRYCRIEGNLRRIRG